MIDRFNRFLDWFSNFFAHRKGLLPLLGIAFVVINLFLKIFSVGWFATTDLFLHLGVLLAILGFMIAWAL